MDIETVTSIIGNFGFPIGVNLILLYILYQIAIKFENEFSEMKTSIQMNTKELAELRSTLKNIGGGTNEKV